MIRLSSLIFLFLILALYVHGQKTTEDYFLETGSNDMDQVIDSPALVIYKYIVEQHPTSKFCSTAHYCIGAFYEKQNEDRLAICAYRAACFDQYKPLSRDTYFVEWDTKPKSVYRLAALYEKIGNYDSALYFFYLGDTVVNVIRSCETGSEAGERLAMLWAADMHVKANQVKTAEKILLHLLLFKKRNYDNFDDYGSDTIVAKLQHVFMLYENLDTLKTQIDIAVNNYSLDTVYDKSTSYRDTLVACYINFLGMKIGYNYRYMITGEPGWDVGTPMPVLLNREKMIALLKTSDLYRLIREL